MKAYSLLFLVTVPNLFLALWVFQPQASPQTQDNTGKQIEVKLIPEKKSIRVGDTLNVRVEIWNIGSKPLFIMRNIYELCENAPLSLRLELGPPPKPQLGHGCAADCVNDAKDSFARRLSYHWTVLPAGDFFGKVVGKDPDSFPQLNTPGRWRLRGTYKSTGGLSISSLCFDTAPIPDEKEQIKQLPYQAWQGTADTNTVWIEVVRGGSSAKAKKSR